MIMADEKVPPVETHGEHGEDELFDPTPHRPRTRTVALVGLVAAGVFAGLFALGVLPRLQKKAAAEQAAQAASGEVAHVVTGKPIRGKAGSEVALPATLLPLQETTLYARTGGFVKRWLVDLGDEVKEGQLLAEIETPELDREIDQARAAAAQAQAVVAQAKTKLTLARSTNERVKNLAASGLASQQDVDEKLAAVDAEEANVRAAEASVTSALANARRLGELKAFAKVVAPFDGTITARNVEIGALVTAGGTTGQPLFKVATTTTVRLFVQVPQLYATSVAVGLDVKVALRDEPKKVFVGKVTRTTKSLDPVSHTLKTEVQIPNQDGALLPGMYVQAKIPAKVVAAPLLVPATALMIDAKGPKVVKIEGGVVRWINVDVGADLGDKVALVGGVAETDDVVTVPSDQLIEGMKVVVDAPPAAKAP